MNHIESKMTEIYLKTLDYCDVFVDEDIEVKRKLFLELESGFDSLIEEIDSSDFNFLLEIYDEKFATILEVLFKIKKELFEDQ